MNNELTKEELNNFTGTENYYHNLIGNFKYTDGVKFLADKGKAYWLLDAIGSYQVSDKIRQIGFQVWKLETNLKTQTARLSLLNEDRKEIVFQEIPYTDFPLEEIEVWLINKVLILPGEY